jgi:hypothetical protein
LLEVPRHDRRELDQLQDGGGGGEHIHRVTLGEEPGSEESRSRNQLENKKILLLFNEIALKAGIRCE